MSTFLTLATRMHRPHRYFMATRTEGTRPAETSRPTGRQEAALGAPPADPNHASPHNVRDDEPKGLTPVRLTHMLADGDYRMMLRRQWQANLIPLDLSAAPTVHDFGKNSLSLGGLPGADAYSLLGLGWLRASANKDEALEKALVRTVLHYSHQETLEAQALGFALGYLAFDPNSAPRTWRYDRMLKELTQRPRYPYRVSPLMQVGLTHGLTRKEALTDVDIEALDRLTRISYQEPEAIQSHSGPQSIFASALQYRTTFPGALTALMHSVFQGQQNPLVVTGVETTVANWLPKHPALVNNGGLIDLLGELTGPVDPIQSHPTITIAAQIGANPRLYEANERLQKIVGILANSINSRVQQRLAWSLTRHLNPQTAPDWIWSILDTLTERASKSLNTDLANGLVLGLRQNVAGSLFQEHPMPPRLATLVRNLGFIVDIDPPKSTPSRPD